jgi:RsiW-degrading membrane proteinase PrsW (M82 family)
MGTLAILAVAPALFWLWWFYRKDRYDPEPRGLVLKIFLLGMLPVFPAAILEPLMYAVMMGQATGSGAENTLPAIIVTHLLVVAPVEEYGKYLVVRRWAFRHPAFNEPLDGIVYAAAAALGFAALENFFYLLGHGAWLILVRGPLSTLGHVLFSAFWGYALGMAWAQTDPVAAKRLINNGVIYAILGHAAFNIVLSLGSLQGDDSGALAALPLLVLPLMVLLYRQVSSHIRTSLANSPFQVTLKPPHPGGDPGRS